jgi:hypothetical protein
MFLPPSHIIISQVGEKTALALKLDLRRQNISIPVVCTR